MNHPQKVAFIGTGSMGRPMIEKLLSAGFEVAVYDLHKNTADSVIALGATWKRTCREAALNSDIVCTCLPLPHHVYEAMTGDDGCLRGMAPGSTWVDCSTTDYHNTLAIARLASEIGCFSVEAPVSNLSHMGVDFCNMSYFAAGDIEGYRALKNFLAITGKIDFYVGKIGKAQAAKLLTNDMFYTACVAFGEVSSVVLQADIPMYWWWEFMKRSRGNSVAVDQFSVFVFDGSWDTSCTLEIAHKDMALTVALGSEVGEKIPVSTATHEAYQEAGGLYDMQTGHMQIVRLTEEANNLTLRIPNFTAPSKYGLNKAYRHPEGLETDVYGRVRPPLPDKFKAPAFEASEKQIRIANTMCEYLALVNEAIYSESVALGVGMGVEKEVVENILRWSVGTCWVADHIQEFQAEQLHLDAATRIFDESGLKLPNFRKVERALRSRHGWGS